MIIRDKVAANEALVSGAQLARDAVDCLNAGQPGKASWRLADALGLLSAAMAHCAPGDRLAGIHDATGLGYRLTSEATSDPLKDLVRSLNAGEMQVIVEPNGIVIRRRTNGAT